MSIIVSVAAPATLVVEVIEQWTPGAGGGTDTAPSSSVAPLVTGSTVRGATLNTTTGTWSGSPTPTLSYQWKRAGSTNVGTNVNSYTTVVADQTFTITCTVTGANASGSASAVSNTFGPITAPTVTFKPTYHIYFF